MEYEGGAPKLQSDRSVLVVESDDLGADLDLQGGLGRCQSKDHPSAAPDDRVFARDPHARGAQVDHLARKVTSVDAEMAT
jgi:hypothetical protein